MNRTPNRPGAAPSPGTTPPSQRDDKRAIRIALVTALIALVAVVVFNLRAPKDRLSAPGEGAPAATQSSPGMAGPSVDPPQPSAPQRGDTPTTPGREGMGAPAGGAPAAQ